MRGMEHTGPIRGKRKKLWNVPFQSKVTGTGAIGPRCMIFFHPDFTVGPGISPGHAFRLAGCTAGGEFHPALKILFNFYSVYAPCRRMSTDNFPGGSPAGSRAGRGPDGS